MSEFKRGGGGRKLNDILTLVSYIMIMFCLQVKMMYSVKIRCYTKRLASLRATYGP